jgi:hypothetical protein
MDTYTPLKKAIHRAIAKAFKSGNQVVTKAIEGMPNKEHALKHIMADINDANDNAEVPSNHIPANSESVLNKDADSLSQADKIKQDIFKQKEQNAKAQVGQLEAQPPQNNMHMKEQIAEKGIQKLKKFMDNKIAKGSKSFDRASHKDIKGVHTSGGFSGLEEEGRSQAGNEITSRAPKAGNQYLKDMHHDRGVSMHAEKLAELRAMPKPNLPKSEEMEKANRFESHAGLDTEDTAKARQVIRQTNKPNQAKGVHKPFGGKDKSMMGQANRGHWAFGDEQGNKLAAQKQHYKVMGEMSNIKPNLPKSEENCDCEICKSVGLEKNTEAKIRQKFVDGVDESIKQTYGQDAPSYGQRTGKMVQGQYRRSGSRGVAFEPDKNEREKLASPNNRGVHNPALASRDRPGDSEIGTRIRDRGPSVKAYTKGPVKGRFHAYLNTTDFVKPDYNEGRSTVEDAKRIHSEKLAELRAMPKPNLPKSEEAAELEKRCWDGYEPVPNKKAYSKGSCRKK